MEGDVKGEMGDIVGGTLCPNGRSSPCVFGDRTVDTGFGISSFLFGGLFPQTTSVFGWYSDACFPGEVMCTEYCIVSWKPLNPLNGGLVAIPPGANAKLFI